MYAIRSALPSLFAFMLFFFSCPVSHLIASLRSYIPPLPKRKEKSKEKVDELFVPHDQLGFQWYIRRDELTFPPQYVERVRRERMEPSNINRKMSFSDSERESTVRGSRGVKLVDRGEKRFGARYGLERGTFSSARLIDVRGQERSHGGEKTTDRNKMA